MIPANKITLSLEEEFLDFSALSTPENDELDAKVSGMDYGLYYPANVDIILHPLTTLTTAEGAVLTTPMERQTHEDEEKTQRSIMRSARKVETQSSGIIVRSVKKALIDTEELIDTAVFDLRSSYNKQMNNMKGYNKLLMPINEELHRSFSCSMLTGDTAADGTAYVTTHYLVFVGQKRAKPLPEFGGGPGRKVTAIRITLPLRAIASIHRAQSKFPDKGLSGMFPQLLNKTIPTFICTGKGQEHEADGVMIFTQDNKLHVIFNITNGIVSHYNDFLAVLNHAWRQLSTTDYSKRPELRLDSEPMATKAE